MRKGSRYLYLPPVYKSEVYSKLLKDINIKHQVLNAKNHENEADYCKRWKKGFSNNHYKYFW